jgi:menaquinone-dependent protoporphyrinogen oxidase
MKVLVCAASKYGATSEIAQAAASVLAAKGLDVTVIPPEKVGAIEEFDAVVLGSAVYMGQWMKPARELAERSAAALATRPVWLFSSGPVGEPAKPADNPVDVTKVLQAAKARDHHIFTGKLARKHLSFPDRAMASAIRAKEGDFATGPKSGNGRPASPTPCLLDDGQIPLAPARSPCPVKARGARHRVQSGRSALPWRGLIFTRGAALKLTP